MNLYAILGVSSEASAAEIKAAFRRRVKELHPDTRTSAPNVTIEVHHLIEAYEILYDPKKRLEYDRARRTAPRESEFNYREWLKERSDDLSKAKLIFYDVLREKSAEAVELYTQMTKERTFQLEKLLGREDFMDCAFMLALQFEAQGDEVQAIQLYLRICQLETERAYFRHFFAEVEDHLLHLLIVKVTWQISPPEFVRILEELQLYPFHPKAKGSFLLKQAEILWNSSQKLLAYKALERAKSLSPKDKAIKRLEKVFSSERV